MRALKFTSCCEEDTERLGEKLGRLLPDGSTVLLKGDIGAGKTCFTRGLAKGLGFDPADVSSPTFTLVHEHRNGRRMYHMDLYRVKDLAEAEDSGLMEYFAADGVAVVEWPDPIEPEIHEGAVVVSIGPGKDEDENSRFIEIELPEDLASGLEDR